MDSEQINRIIELHKKWLNDEPGGERADLHGAYLCGANLHGAYLREADLREADLSEANLREANLREANLYGANLREANLYKANLREANLYKANLREADLCGAYIDSSCFPLWCGGLDVHIDDRQAIQLLYHLVRNVLFSKNTSAEMKKLLGNAEIVDVANRFHRVDECGKIKYYAEKTEAGT